MRRRSSAAVLAAVLLAAAAPRAGEPPLPARAIVILVASWCAPCRGELARLNAIEGAAGGRAVRVLAIDDGAATARMLRPIDPARVWRPEPMQRALVRSALLERTAGLPYSVVTDARGTICAEENGGLDAVRTAALIRRCVAP